MAAAFSVAGELFHSTVNQRNWHEVVVMKACFAVNWKSKALDEDIAGCGSKTYVASMSCNHVSARQRTVDHEKS